MSFPLRRWSRRHMWWWSREDLGPWMTNENLPDNHVGHVTWEINMGCVKKLRFWSYCGRTLPVLTDTRSRKVWNLNEHTQLGLWCSVLCKPTRQPSENDGSDHLLRSFLTFTVLTSAILKGVSRLILDAVIATAMQLQKGGKEEPWHAALQSWLIEELSCFQRAFWFT